ncbi:MAG: phosphodiester glycosidase family protein [Clostridia bacterium]|nr:phosphodiester glycosidase family protein [Clostridia bacterium]
MISTLTLIDTGNSVKAVIQTKYPVNRASLFLNDVIFKDEFNEDEPYDLKAHVFHIPKEIFREGSEAVFSYRTLLRPKLQSDRSETVLLPGSAFVEPADLLSGTNSGIVVQRSEEEQLFPGLKCSDLFCVDSDNAPVRLFTVEADMKNVTVYVGTKNDGVGNTRARATIPEMVQAAEKKGKNVLAAVNADFFDINGDFHPAGLCVKNGAVIANPDSKRPFIGVCKDGSAVITSLIESPGILDRLDCAASGLEMLLKDGEIYDVALGEPFGYVRHPRSAVGIRNDGSVVVLEVDGRIPKHSNGATLTDLALFLKSMGCVRALNLDGGGSSAVYTKKDGELQLRTVPADLFFPTAKLIRKDFNSLLFIEKR